MKQNKVYFFVATRSLSQGINLRSGSPRLTRFTRIVGSRGVILGPISIT